MTPTVTTTPTCTAVTRRWTASLRSDRSPCCPRTPRPATGGSRHTSPASRQPAVSRTSPDSHPASRWRRQWRHHYSRNRWCCSVRRRTAFRRTGALWAATATPARTSRTIPTITVRRRRTVTWPCTSDVSCSALAEREYRGDLANVHCATNCSMR